MLGFCLFFPPATPTVYTFSSTHTLSNTSPLLSQVVVFDIDETVLSNLPQILDPETWPWPKWVEAAKAPALKPTLRFYNSLCDAGYSVAFITGRKEDSRNSTMRNLEAEGYGKPCKPGPGPFYGVRPAGSRECCYVALYLRAPGDTSLASVYKPGARKDLLAKGGSGMSLVALVGDQFSDLNGEESAPYAFKLNNPWYYIL
jgi:predicted secreted acid phosphatase